MLDKFILYLTCNPLRIKTLLLLFLLLLLLLLLLYSDLSRAQSARQATPHRLRL